MKLSSMNSSHEPVCDLKRAKTGIPFKCLLYRGQYKNITDHSRGIFYTPDLSTGSGYATSGSNLVTGRKGHLIKKILRFENPYVCSGTSKAMMHLVNSGVVKAEVARKLIERGIYAFPPGERLLASGMRQLGYDAIIYNNGLDEVVDLR